METNNIGRRSEEPDSERTSHIEESSHLCYAACKQILPPLDADLREAIRSMKLDISTANTLRQYGIRHFEEVLNLNMHEFHEAGMKLLHARRLQNLARNSTGIKEESNHVESCSSYQVTKADSITDAVESQEVQDALNYMEADMSTKSILQTFGIRHIEEILALWHDHLIMANLTPTQADQLQQMAMKVYEERWLKFLHTGRHADGALSH